jgi:hypothetical protein
MDWFERALGIAVFDRGNGSLEALALAMLAVAAIVPWLLVHRRLHA